MLKDRLRELMNEKGWSVPRLENISGVRRNTIYKMLRGERGKQSRHDTITKLADALATTPKDLIGEEEEWQPVNERQVEYMDFAAVKPDLTVLTDHPLRADEAYRDNFRLKYRLGPVYDILRYQRTETPMAILISGDWGTGKTSAMRWLHGLLDIWNKQAGRNDIKVRPVWFYPWKYDNKRDVWRGFIWEVIMGTVDAGKANVQTVRYAVDRFGSFFGRSFVRVLASIALKTETRQNTRERDSDLSGLREVIAAQHEPPYAQRAYLNEFETALRSWIEYILGPSDRMVIFIDDLDRCMPEVALQVVEAMHLYLNIEKLIFVVGVDKKVVEKLVVEHYKKLGLVTPREKDESDEEKRQRAREEEKAKQYLSKMFQVEVHLEPTEQQISDFFDEQLRELTYWREPYLSSQEQALFRDLVLKFAGRNPREVKRLLNSALMTGAGAAMMGAPREGKDG
jgi:transcriptional regulator with XRE-family HTH domain